MVWYGVYGMVFYLTQMFLSWTPMEAKVSRKTEQWEKKKQWIIYEHIYIVIG